MTARRSLVQVLGSAQHATLTSTRVFLRDVAQGMLDVSHNTLALVGLALVTLLMLGAGREDVRQSGESLVLNWLQSRQEARRDVRVDPEQVALAGLAEPDAISRATATNPKELNRQQAAVAQWLSRRYRVAPEPISRLVSEAWAVGPRVGLDPTLILALMAIESSFNPFAQSPVGAQGLMQVMTQIHDDKYQAFGGKFAAFDPVTNLRVGVQVLKECITRAGGLEAGLKYYVGAANMADDGGYAAKVLAEQANLRQIASGHQVALNVTLPATTNPTPLAVANAANAANTAAALRTVADVVKPAASASRSPAPVAPVTPEAVPEQVALLR
ncbi:MAG: hypothetical protein RJA98_269 [Pseudomonadota bacterium]|jgi:hypothetical protein